MKALTGILDPICFALAGLLLLAAGNQGGCTFPGTNPAGPRLVLIVHEQDTDTTGWGAFVKDIRTGEPAKYINDHKHTLEILDDDTKDDSGQPSPFLAKYAPYTVPELVIVAGEKAIHREKLPADPKAADVLAVLKKNGG